MVVLAAALGIMVHRVAGLHVMMGDFRAFYCAAQVRLQGGDPYEAEPLARCEAVPAPAAVYTAKPGETLPAPLPGYLIAAFVPLALLPFGAAIVVWAIALAAATAGGVYLLHRLRVGSLPTLIIALAIPLCAVSFSVGELPPIAFAGIALAAWGAGRACPPAVGIGIALAMAEPQLGVACALAALLLSRRFVAPVVAVSVALLLLSIVTLGVKENVEYVVTVLPLHLAAEIPTVQQYSLTWVLHGLGVADGPALLLGRLSYVAMLALAAWFARSRTARRAPAAAVLAAPAFAVVGGPFVHLDHIALALPAALWLSSQHTRASLAQLAATVALAVPLLFVLATTALILIVPCVAGWVVASYGRDRAIGLRSAAVATVLVVLAGLTVLRTGTGLESSVLHPVAGASIFAQESWAEYIRRHNVMTGWVIWLLKMPTWYGLLATAALCVLSNFRREAAA
ncbi:MAG: DUF2029 domain-containing protein [bacterium]|nr:DUF2029 domain-containing protein [bacterium]